MVSLCTIPKNQLATGRAPKTPERTAFCGPDSCSTLGRSTNFTLFDLAAGEVRLGSLGSSLQGKVNSTLRNGIGQGTWISSLGWFNPKKVGQGTLRKGGLGLVWVGFEALVLAEGKLEATPEHLQTTN